MRIPTRSIRSAIAALTITVVIASCSPSKSSPNVESGSGQQNATPTAPQSVATNPTTTSTTSDPNADDEGAVAAGASNAAVPTQHVSATARLCRSGDPLANVYHPARLRVVDACATVSGTVRSVRAEDDGDVHFDLEVQSDLVNEFNVADQHGWLVAEIVPADRPGCTPGTPPQASHDTYDYGICTGADIAEPSVGDVVTVTGPYVVDEHHGWMEIHPVWALSAGRSAGGSSPSPGAVVVRPPTPPSRTTTPPSHPIGAPTVHPGAYCAPVGASGQTISGTHMVCSLTNASGIPYKGGRARWRSG